MRRLLKSRNVLDRQNFKSFHEKRRIFKSLYTSIKRYTCNHFKKHGLHLVNKVQKNGKINISPRKMISALSASLNYQTCSFFLWETQQLVLKLRDKNTMHVMAKKRRPFFRDF